MLKRMKLICGGILLLLLVILLSQVQAAVTWQQTSGPPGATVYSLAIDPLTPQTIYAGTEYNGLFKSIDGGSSWSTSIFSDGLINAVVIDPINPQTIYAVISGLSKSIDGGSSWSAMNGGLFDRYDTGVLSLAIDPTNSQTIYAGTTTGAFKSTNGGSFWSAINDGLPPIYVDPYSYVFPYIVSLAIDPATPQTVYAGTDYNGVFKSTDGGNSWSAVNSGLPSGELNQWNILVIDPTSPQTVYTGIWGGGVFKSTNGGTTWSAANSGLTGTYVDTLAIDPTNSQTIYVSIRGGGVFKSTDGGNSWNAAGLTNESVYSLAIDPTNSETIYAGTFLNGVFKGLSTSDVPTISGSPATTATVGIAYTFTPSSSNAQSFSITGSVPPGLNFNTATGILSGTPTTAGTYNDIVITATNTSGSASLPSFSITVFDAGTAAVPPGDNVTVTPTPDVSITFDSVSTGGTVTVKKTKDPSVANFKVTTDAMYSIQTNASHGGNAKIDAKVGTKKSAITYETAITNNNYSNIKMLHYNGRNWEDVTTSVDPVNGVVTGTVSFL